MNTVRYSKHRASRQAGSAALIVTLMLCLALALAALYLNRHLVVAQRSAANQVRSTQAFEAAEAGVQWAIAQLGSGRAIGANCLPSADPAAGSFRARYLGFDLASGLFTPRRWPQGVGTPLQAACVRVGNGWSCSCPTQGAPLLAAGAGPAPAPAFLLEFLPSARPGVVQLAATGCTTPAGDCQPGAAAPADAQARIEVALGLVGGLRTPPSAAVTTLGAFDVGSAALGVHNADPATGIAIHAGGAIVADRARLTTPAGASTAGALVGDDATLAGLSPQRFFASLFGIDENTWARQLAVTRVDCTLPCEAALAAAMDAAGDNALIHVDGDLRLTGPLTLGSVQRPVVIVAAGAVRLDGAVQLTGLVYGSSLSWDRPAAGALLRGAAVSASQYRGDGTPQLVYDAGVLATLAGNRGSFAVVSGSWRDF